eukprot:Rmarinus@m.14719
MSDDNAAYFESYDDLSVHELMLKDRPRTEAYRDAILNNPTLFEGKVVLDVGCGTGILSMFAAKAKAKKVYAVEASHMSDVAKILVEKNNFEDLITVIHGPVESISLPEKVDVIISEWMGFYLLHESMLGSVFVARDKWLKDGGVLFPNHASLKVAPFEWDAYHQEKVNFWDEVYGFDFSAIKPAAGVLAYTQPRVECIDASQLKSSPIEVLSLDLQTTHIEHLVEFQEKLEFKGIEGNIHGFCIWFDVTFPGKDCPPTVLSTSPGSPATHWKQFLVFLPKPPLICSRQDRITCNLHLCQSGDNARHYDISIVSGELLESKADDGDVDMDANVAGEDSTEHPIPCDCDRTKCKLIRTYMEKFPDPDLPSDAEVIEM